MSLTASEHLSLRLMANSSLGFSLYGIKSCRDLKNCST